MVIAIWCLMQDLNDSQCYSCQKKAETLRSHTFSVMPENLKSDNKIKGYPRNICPLGKQEDDLK